MRLFIRLPAANRFTPDIFLKDGELLNEFGLEAEIVEIPGHSLGSIGVLTTDQVLFCGDLLANVGNPDLWTIMDVSEAAEVNVEKLLQRQIERVYPGHGESFTMQEFINNYKIPVGGSPNRVL